MSGTPKRVQGSESDLGALFLCARDCNGSYNDKRPNSLNDRGTGIVFSRDRGGDVWLTWFKKDDSAFVEFGQDGMLLLDAVPSHHLPNAPRYVWSGPTVTR